MIGELERMLQLARSDVAHMSGKDQGQERIHSMKSLFHVFVVGLTLLLASGSQARADDITWDYQWDRTPAAVLAGTGGVSFTNELQKQAVNSSDIVATNLKVFSTAAPNAPDVLGAGANYTLKLTLTDVASGKVGSLSWNGALSGSFSASGSNVINTFTSALTQFLSLGNNTYTVTIGPYSPPGPPSESNSGSIAAFVDVASNGSINNTTPEPSTLLLSFLGVSVMGAAGWRKRRTALAAV